MLKRIPKSDISIRPFKAYKEWSFDDTSNEISLFEANISSSELSNGVQKNSLYGQLRAQFYNGHEDNPFLRFGNKSLEYNVNPNTSDRFLSGSAKVISIPQIYVGEGIKKGSVVLIDNSHTFQDDSNGNLISSDGDSTTVTLIDNEDRQFNFTDIAFNAYSASMLVAPTLSVNLEDGTLDLVYNSITYSMNLVSFDTNTGVMLVENIPFLDGAAGVSKIGNVFYSQGLVVITRNPNELLQSDWELNFKSTETIYENEFLLIVEPDEFNVSQNPSAVVVVGEEKSVIEDSNGISKKVVTNTGVKYIRKLSTLDNGVTLDYRYSSSLNPSILAGFEHNDLVGSSDTTGSFLAPFITTIGLYDDNCDLVAVAKLPQPIKSEPELPINFIVRFDT
jgi:hypothetical protein